MLNNAMGAGGLSQRRGRRKIKRLKVILVTLMLLVAFTIAGCSPDGAAITYPIYLADDVQKVGIVLSAPEKSDPVLNHLILSEIQQFTVNNDVEFTVLEPGDLVNNTESLRYLAENKYDLVIGLGKEIHKDVDKVAAEYPDIRFALFEGQAQQVNVSSLVIKDAEGAFLAGAAAALLSSANVVGYLGDPAGSDKEKDAFARGVQYVNLQENKMVKISLPNLDPAPAEGGDYQLGNTLANRLYWSGADVVFSTAAKYSGGLADSARKNKKIAIMGDMGFLQANPHNIYGAVQTNRNKAIFDLLKTGVNGKLGGGLRSYGVSEEVVNLVLSEAVPQEIKDKLNIIRDNIRKNNIDTSAIILPGDLFIQLVQPALKAPVTAGGTKGKTSGNTSGKTQGNTSGNTQGNASSNNPADNPGSATENPPDTSPGTVPDSADGANQVNPQ